MLSESTLRGEAAIVGIGESRYYKHGRSPDTEFVLAIKAIKAACADAQLAPVDLDGFCSYSNDRNGPVRLGTALGVRELRYSVMQWDGGGGGMAGAIANAVGGIMTGQANYVVVVRALAQGEFGRFGQHGPFPRPGARHPNGADLVTGDAAFERPYGVSTGGQRFALKFMRWMHEQGGVGLKAQKAVSLTSYQHAQQNPRAVMFGKPLSSQQYDDARMIVEPWRLYDFCQESDGAAALIVTSAHRAKDLARRPVYILGAVQGAANSAGMRINNSPQYSQTNFSTLAPRLWEMAKISPSEIDVVQSYESYGGGVVMSLAAHGFCKPEAVDDELTFDDLTVGGRLPLNTAGGNLAEAYVHGLNLAVEGVRQLRGESVNQVAGARSALVSSGPLSSPTSDVVLGTEELL